MILISNVSDHSSQHIRVERRENIQLIMLKIVSLQRVIKIDILLTYISASFIGSNLDQSILRRGLVVNFE